MTFGTLKFVERLTAAGVPELQAKAKAMAEVQIEAWGEPTALTSSICFRHGHRRASLEGTVVPVP